MDLKLNFDPKLFDPRQPPRRAAAAGGKRGNADRQVHRDGSVYVYQQEIVLAVNAALATSRPLLVKGPPGTGKSSLARNIALHLGWRFYQKVITSRTQAQDLLWTFDALQRLRDAQAGALSKDNARYVHPGVLWWALSPESAARRGAIKPSPKIPPAKDPSPKTKKPHAVVLLDEIDKADPDVPNDLLGPLGDDSFEVTDINQVVTRTEDHQVLLVITSNDERDLSPAFIRRCILLELKAPNRKRLIEIAQQHLGPEDVPLYQELADAMEQDREKARAMSLRPPSTAEYLDAVAACLKLGIRPSSPSWPRLAPLVLSKFLSAEDAREQP